MSDEKKTTAESSDAAKPAEAEATENQAQAEPTEAAPPDPAEAVAAENAELRDRLLRAVAEMENLRKRTEREVRDAGQYAITSFARDLLGVVDNMRRALESVDEGARKHADAALKALLDGVELTERDFLAALDRHGVKRIDPAGEKFDPNFHQAMFEVPDESVPSGTVVQVAQAGYTIGERVLRPAMVGVARGGPKPAAGNGGDVGASIDRTA